MGFGALLNIGCTTLPRELCIESVKAFDPVTRTLSVRGISATMRANDVHGILRIPCEWKDVPTKYDVKKMSQVHQEFHNM